MTQIELLPKTHDRCLALQLPEPPVATDTECGFPTRGALGANHTCNCFPPYFGPHCIHGCSNHTLLTSFGQDFASTAKTLPGIAQEYLNDQNCKWILEPPPFHVVNQDDIGASVMQLAPVTGIRLIVYALDTENGRDQLFVYAGNTTTPDALIGTYSGHQTRFVVMIPSAVATLVFKTSVWNPSATQPDHILWNGWTASYHALGCPAGHQILFNDTAKSWSCDACVPGAYSGQSNSFNCSVCQSTTYSSMAGSTTCSTCLLGTYQSGTGQSQCLDCASNGYPEGFCDAPSQLSESARIGLTTTAALVGGLTAAGLAVIFINRKSRLVVPATPSVLLLILVGLIGFTMAGVAIVQKQNAETCAAQILIMNLSFHLVVASLALKSWRLHRIFNATVLHKESIRDWHLFVMVFGLLCVDIILLTTWQVVSPPAISYSGRCGTGDGNLGSILGLVMIVMKAVMLAGGMIIAYEIRDIPAQFNESRQMALAIYNISFLCVLFVGLIYGLGETFSPDRVMTLEFVAVIYGAVSTFFILFGPLLYKVLSGYEQAPFRGSSAAGGGSPVGGHSVLVSKHDGHSDHGHDRTFVFVCLFVVCSNSV